MTNIDNNFSIVFPGQGSQALGMLKNLAASYTQVQEVFAEGSAVLGYDLWDLVQNGPEEKLNQTEYTQPILLVASVAVWRIWRTKNNAQPDFLAGHSLGEYTALVCADAIGFSDAIKLVQDRGRFMQGAYTGANAMVAIVGLTDDMVKNICSEAAQNEVLVPANYNAIGQTVIAGQLNAAQRAIDLAKKAGAKIAKILPVSIPSHCALMTPAAELLKQRLAQVPITTPKIPVIHNADVGCHSDPNEIREILVRQLYSPVRWVETIQYMHNHGVKTILECGPGKVLTGLNKRINAEIIADFLGEPEKMEILRFAQDNN